MEKEKKQKRTPAVLFFITAIAASVISGIYFLFFPDAYFDLSLRSYFTIGSGMLWLVFAGYLLLLSAVYFVAAKGNLKTHSWLVGTHYVFVLLFLLVFLVFSQFNERYVRTLLSSYPAVTVFVVYTTVFLLDVMLLFCGLALLAVNLIQFSKPEGSEQEN